MGLLENLAMNAIQGTNTNSLASGLLQMIQNQPGGLQGLLQCFHEKGLGGLASSWVSNGPNPPASSEQIHQVLGSDKVSQLAASAGISSDAAGSAIGQILPGLVDKLTPNGQVGEHNNIMDIASSLLGSFSQEKAS